MVSWAHTVRESVVIACSLLALALDSPHSEEYNSLEQEMVEFALCIYLLFWNKLDTAYYYLEKAAHNTLYASSIKPY